MERGAIKNKIVRNLTIILGSILSLKLNLQYVMKFAYYFLSLPLGTVFKYHGLHPGSHSYSSDSYIFYQLFIKRGPVINANTIRMIQNAINILPNKIKGFSQEILHHGCGVIAHLIVT